LLMLAGTAEIKRKKVLRGDKIGNAIEGEGGRELTKKVSKPEEGLTVGEVKKGARTIKGRSRSEKWGTISPKRGNMLRGCKAGKNEMVHSSELGQAYNSK